ncbi:PH domain-containing protein [Micromonospora sp. SH-82]|uniref:PH domain-containing protein n=1 Tax=Micromonospora sp. SH-82 TaxID=3132938 RepID=UPI003EB84737
MATRFNTPPGWPDAPEGWLPPAGWQPDPSWPPPPPGWRLFVDDAPAPAAAPGPANLPAVRPPTTVTAPHPPVVAVTPNNHPGPAPQPAPTPDPGVLWAAKGNPVTGFGGGRYSLTATLLFVEKGMLSTRGQQVPVADVVDIDLRQSIVQKSRGVGNILVQVQRPHGIEWAVLEDVPEPQQALSILNRAVHDARLLAQKRSQTRVYENLSPSTSPFHTGTDTSAPPTSAAAPDPLEQLRLLGQLREAGVLTEQEFAVKKAEILARL